MADRTMHTPHHAHHANIAMENTHDNGMHARAQRDGNERTLYDQVVMVRDVMMISMHI